MSRYIIKYYNCFLSDPRTMWDILQAVVYAPDPNAAEFLFWRTGIDIISVEKDESYKPPTIKLLEEA